MEEYRKTLDKWLGEWNWEWFLSLSLGSDLYKGRLLRLVRDLQEEERLQLAYLGVFSSVPSPHLHLLALGRDNSGRSLNDLGESKMAFWRLRWQQMTHCSGDIRQVQSKGVIGYIANKNTPEFRFELLHPYNQKLLHRTRIAA